MLPRFFLALAVVSPVFLLASCGSIVKARQESARGTITNEREKTYGAGVQGKTVFIVVNAIENEKAIRDASDSFGSALYQYLRERGYDAKQFAPENKEKLTRYMAKIQKDMERDPSMLVLQFIPRVVQIETTELKSGRKTTTPAKIDIYVGAYQKTLASPAYTYSGDWSYNSDSRFNVLTESVVSHLIKAGFLLDRPLE